MRVALGAILFLEPEILLLNEPTNYLDLEGTMWLESHLKNYPHTVLIVSHDRDLLNRAVDSILHLDKGKLTLYSGGYDDFEEARREKQRLELKLKKKQDDQRRHIQAFIDRFKAKASKASQAQSRVKALAKMQPIAAQIDDRVFPFLLPNPAKAIASPLLRLEGASAGYEADKPILTRPRSQDRQRRPHRAARPERQRQVDIRQADRGPPEAPFSGKVFGAQKVEVGYFAQHQLNDLNPLSTPFDYMIKLMPDGTEAQRRGKLGSFGFSADKADTKCENLSGGEKARLLLALTAFHAPNLLILDEPTNHLDVDSREALIHALMDYDGAVILISHDRHLVEATADRLWIVKDGTVKVYDGDMESYRAELLSDRGQKSRDRSSDKDTTEGAGASRADQRRASAERRSQLAPIRKAVADAEKVVEKLARDISLLDLILANSDLYARDPAKAQQSAQERGRLAKQLSEAEEIWLAASVAYEDASTQT